MRLSDAIALGRTLVDKPRGGSLRGCALGMGLLAMSASLDYETAAELWPWMSTVDYHCEDCKKYAARGYDLTDIAGVKIFSAFDYHVDARRNMNLDQFIDYVRSIEPFEKEISVDAIPVEEVEYASMT